MEIVAARTRSGYWKALNTEPISTRTLEEFQGKAEGWLIDKGSRQLVPLGDISSPPFWAYVEHRCAEYLEARPIEPIPAQGEKGLVKVGLSQEFLSMLAELEAVEEINRVKQARKTREKLTESEPSNVE